MPEAIGVVHIPESSSQTPPPPPPQTRVPAGRASRGLCSRKPGSLWAATWGLHPPETWAGAPGACPRSYQLLWSCRQAGSEGMVLGSQLRVPRKGPGQTQRLPKQQNTTPPFRRLPPPYPPLASPLPTRTGKEGHGARSPALQKQLEATVIWSPPGVSGAPGSLPSKAQPGPNQSRALFRASHQPSSTRPAEDGGKKKSLNATPAKPVFLFSLWLTQKKHPRRW